MIMKSTETGLEKARRLNREMAERIERTAEELRVHFERAKREASEASEASE